MKISNGSVHIFMGRWTGMCRNHSLGHIIRERDHRLDIQSWTSTPKHQPHQTLNFGFRHQSVLQDMLKINMDKLLLSWVGLTCYMQTKHMRGIYIQVKCLFNFNILNSSNLTTSLTTPSPLPKPRLLFKPHPQEHDKILNMTLLNKGKRTKMGFHKFQENLPSKLKKALPALLKHNVNTLMWIEPNWWKTSD